MYILHNTVLENIFSTKYLGVTISDDLSYSAEFSLGFWKQEFKNPSLRKVGVKIEK